MDNSEEALSAHNHTNSLLALFITHYRSIFRPGVCINILWGLISQRCRYQLAYHPTRTVTAETRATRMMMTLPMRLWKQFVNYLPLFNMDSPRVSLYVPLVSPPPTTVLPRFSAPCLTSCSASDFEDDLPPRNPTLVYREIGLWAADCSRRPP
jgi:hypothetical protein